MTRSGDTEERCGDGTGRILTVVAGTQIYTYDKTACNCRHTKGYM